MTNLITRIKKFFSSFGKASSPFHSVLCLDGELPNQDFLQNLKLPIIAADGVANKLMAMGIKPDLVVGDLDSLHSHLHDELDTLHKPDQNTCDYHKSIEYLKEQNLLPALVCGINGGAIDHVLNNVNLFLQNDCVMYAPPCIGYVLRENTTKSHSLPLGTKVSFIGIPSACVSSNGLRWELNHYAMSFPGENSCFNQTVKEKVEWTAEQGNVLVLIYSDILIV